MPTPTKFKFTKDISRKDILFCVARVPGTRQVFVGSSDGNVHHLDLVADKPESVAMAGHRGYVTGVALAGKQLVSGAYDGQLICGMPPRARRCARRGRQISGACPAVAGSAAGGVGHG